MQNMETRYTHSPADIRHYSTEQLRDEFLVEKVFIPGAISLTYTHNDRMIFGGVTPTTEELEIMDEKLIESMDAVGANFWQKLFYVRIPSLLPIYSSLILNHVEIAIRSAATLGLVGAGGIGAPLIFAIQTRNWSKVSILLIGVVLTIFVLDQVTELIRKKLR